MTFKRLLLLFVVFSFFPMYLPQNPVKSSLMFSFLGCIVLHHFLVPLDKRNQVLMKEFLQNRRESLRVLNLIISCGIKLQRMINWCLVMLNLSGIMIKI